VGVPDRWDPLPVVLLLRSDPDTCQNHTYPEHCKEVTTETMFLSKIRNRNALEHRSESTNYNDEKIVVLVVEYAYAAALFIGNMDKSLPKWRK
jgi:hypothetical protein